MESTADETVETTPVETSSQQKSNAEILAARREARRRRILENSNNRLSKITGREHNEPPLEPLSNVIYPDPEMERDSLGPNDMQQEPDVLEMLREMRAQSGASGGQQQPKEPPSRLNRFLHTKRQYMLMGMIVALLYATDNEWLIGNSVFLPLFCWEAVEVFLLKTYESNLNWIGIIFVFLGVKQHWVQIITKILETINKIFKDFSCFIWFFVMTHVFWGKVVLWQSWDEVLYPNGREEGAACPTP
uniref:CSON012769 protein n=1 Tax=Culicoides sonorensis TaxID=179676 RepID=A0A336KN72_CULSO